MSTTAPSVTPSVVRTVVPYIVAGVLWAAAKIGLNLPYDGTTVALLPVITAAYFTAVRLLEVHVDPRFGWLLGKPGSPTYEAAKNAPTLSTALGTLADVVEAQLLAAANAARDARLVQLTTYIATLGTPPALGTTPPVGWHHPSDPSPSGATATPYVGADSVAGRTPAAG